MNKLIKRPLGTITNPNGGERTPLRMVNGARTSYITLVARATLTLAGSVATAIRNRGSVWALFDQIVIDENGTDRFVVDGRVLRFLSEMAAPSALTATRATSLANGVYVLEEAVRLYFAHPLALDPTETAFSERDSRQVLNVSVQYTTTPNTKLVDLGGTVSAVSVLAYQAMEEPNAAASKPLFIPAMRQIIVPILGAVTQQPEYIRSTNAIRGIVLTQETTTVGEVSDIINSFTLRGDYRHIIGPQPMSLRDLQLDSEFEFGGAVVSSNKAHVGINFQRYGKLSDVLNPAQDANLRVELNAQPSASAGNSQVRMTLLELIRNGDAAGLVADAVPFAY